MSLSLALALFAGLAVVLIVIVIFSFRVQSAKLEEIRRDRTENQAFTLMQQQIGQLTQNIIQQIQTMQSQFRETTGHIGQNLGDVKSHLSKVEVVTREVLEKSKNIGALEDLLRAPKFRGGMGELFLGDLLGQILPPANFELQYKFRGCPEVT